MLDKLRSSDNIALQILAWTIDLIVFVIGLTCIGCCGNVITCGAFSNFYAIFAVIFGIYGVISAVIFTTRNDLDRQEIIAAMSASCIRPVELLISGMILGKGTDFEIAGLTIYTLYIAVAIAVIGSIITIVFGVRKLKTCKSRGRDAVVRKAENKVKKKTDRDYEKNLNKAKSLSEVRMLESEHVQSQVEEEQDTTSHVAALEDMRRQLEEGRNGDK